MSLLLPGEWRCPPTGVVKLNVDASARSNSGELVLGGLCRDADGNWLFGFISKLGHGHITKAKVFAIYHGLEIAWEWGCGQVIIESDSLLAVSKVNGPLSSTDPLFQVLHACKPLLQKSWHCTMVHAYREANMCTDYLASWAIQGDFCITHLDNPLGQLHGLLQEDLIGVAWPRAISVC